MGTPDTTNGSKFFHEKSRILSAGYYHFEEFSNSTYFIVKTESQ